MDKWAGVAQQFEAIEVSESNENNSKSFARKLFAELTSLVIFMAAAFVSLFFAVIFGPWLGSLIFPGNDLGIFVVMLAMTLLPAYWIAKKIRQHLGN